MQRYISFICWRYEVENIFGQVSIVTGGCADEGT